MLMHDYWMDLNYLPPYDLFTMLLTWWLQYKLYGFKVGRYNSLNLKVTLKMARFWETFCKNNLMIILQWQQSLHYCMTGLKMHSCRSSSPCTISHNPFIIQSGWANYIQTQLGQVALDHCSHFGWDLHAFTAYTHLPWNQHWDRKEWKKKCPAPTP